MLWKAMGILARMIPTHLVVRAWCYCVCGRKANRLTEQRQRKGAKLQEQIGHSDRKSVIPSRGLCPCKPDTSISPTPNTAEVQKWASLWVLVSEHHIHTTEEPSRHTQHAMLNWLDSQHPLNTRSPTMYFAYLSFSSLINLMEEHLLKATAFWICLEIGWVLQWHCLAFWDLTIKGLAVTMYPETFGSLGSTEGIQHVLVDIEGFFPLKGIWWCRYFSYLKRALDGWANSLWSLGECNFPHTQNSVWEKAPRLLLSPVRNSSLCWAKENWAAMDALPLVRMQVTGGKMGREGTVPSASSLQPASCAGPLRVSWEDREAREI